MKGNIKIHQAEFKDLELVRRLLQETALWLRSIGSTQWSDILEGRDNHNILQAVKNGEVYYATIDKQPAGMFLLWASQSEWDAGLWGNEAAGEWFYLHRLMIRRQYAGTSFARRLLESAKEIAGNKQKKGIRLDCMAERDYLNYLYTQAGFVLIKNVKEWDIGNETADFNLYQYTIE